MRTPSALSLAPVALLLTLFAWPTTPSAGSPGDSICGKITAVKRADLVVLDYGAGTYEVRLAGLDLPRDRSSVRTATRWVADELLNKYVRMRFDGRTEQGEMVGKILMDDAEVGVRDIAVEMVRRGLARRSEAYAGYRYNEMVTAEREAREARRGVWLKQ